VLRWIGSKVPAPKGTEAFDFVKAAVNMSPVLLLAAQRGIETSCVVD
jgi:hypothetical protein